MRSITLLCLATLALAQDLPGNTTATRACHLPGHTGYDFCNVSLTIDQRVNNLISLLKPEDKAPLLTARESPLGAIPRLGLPEYDWGTNCIHGAQTRCGSKCPTSFPNPNAQGAAWNRSLWKDMAHVTGVELRALWLADLGENHQDNLPHLGLDCWSPNININRDPRWGRNLETPGEDPYLNGQYGEWHTSGLQNGEDKRYLLAIVTLKHWDAYSLEDNGNRAGGISRHNFDAKVTKQDLAGTYFPAFKQAVRGADAKGVMCSYNAVNGVPSCASKFLLQNVLRDAWNFTGYVTSDSGAVEDIYARHHYQNMTAAQGVAAAVLAGCDIDSSLDKGHTSSGSPYTWSLQDALDQKLVKDADVNALLYRSLKMRFELGLFDPIETQPYWHYKVDSVVDTPKSQELNLLATRSSLVLLKNDGPMKVTADGAAAGAHATAALPLKTAAPSSSAPSSSASAATTLVLIGPHSNARQALVGNYLGQICKGEYNKFDCVQSPAEAMTAAHSGSTVVVEGSGVTSSKAKDGSDIAAAVKAATADGVMGVVLMVGLDTQNVEKEGHDRTDLSLPSAQQALIKAVSSALTAKAVAQAKKEGKAAMATPVTMVLLNGGAVATDDESTDAAISGMVEAFYPGVLGAKVIAEVLFGVTNPGAKMPYTVMPASYAKDVDFLDMNMSAAPGSTGQGRTYRYYNGKPLYEFGFGLSYTTFTLAFATEQAATHTLPAGYSEGAAPSYTIKVTNTGKVEGDEVVQAYFLPDTASVKPSKQPAPLPLKQLFCFERVTLAPGASTTVTCKVPAAALALADATGDLVSCPGKYQLLFTNGNDAHITQDMQLTGAEVVIESFPKGETGFKTN